MFRDFGQDFMAMLYYLQVRRERWEEEGVEGEHGPQLSSCRWIHSANPEINVSANMYCAKQSASL